MLASTAVAHRIPAGWYRDKDEPTRRRWWDGVEWTNHYAPNTDSLVMPVVAPQPQPVDHATHSPEISIPTLDALAIRRPIPLAVIVFLAGLSGANIVLLGIFFSGR